MVDLQEGRLGRHVVARPRRRQRLLVASGGCIGLLTAGNVAVHIGSEPKWRIAFQAPVHKAIAAPSVAPEFRMDFGTSTSSRIGQVRRKRRAEVARTVAHQRGSFVSQSSRTKLEEAPAELCSIEAQRACLSLHANEDTFDAAIQTELRRLEKASGSSVSIEAQSELQRSLNRRFAEIQESQHTDAVAELVYLRVVRSFRDLDAPMALRRDGLAEFESLDPKRLIGPHSPDALQVIKEHVMALIGPWDHLDREFPLRLSTYQASQAYVVSALLGFYLRRVDLRYQLEKMVGSFEAVRSQLPSIADEGHDGTRSRMAATMDGGALGRYIASFGHAEMQQTTVPASREAQRALELQVFGLFGDVYDLKHAQQTALSGASNQEEAAEQLRLAVATGKVPAVDMTVSGLRRLVLEGVAFGSLLSAAEKQVSEVYELRPGSDGALSTLLEHDSSGGSLGGHAIPGLHLGSLP